METHRIAGIPEISPVDKERFLQRVDVRGPDECWPFKSRTSPGKHGVFWANGKSHGAHRIAYAVAYGPIRDGLFVCHHCDNPPCCNPSHLFLGSARDNARDAISKGRYRIWGSNRGGFVPRARQGRKRSKQPA